MAFVGTGNDACNQPGNGHDCAGQKDMVYGLVAEVLNGYDANDGKDQATY